MQWDDNASQQENLERIITQKWIACFPLGQEGWAEFRRTGYPRLMGAVYSYGSEITDKQAGARRMRYPKRIPGEPSVPHASHLGLPERSRQPRHETLGGIRPTSNKPLSL